MKKLTKTEQIHNYHTCYSSCHQIWRRYQCPPFVTSEKADSQKKASKRRTGSSVWVCTFLQVYIHVRVHILCIFTVCMFVRVYKYLLYVYTVIMFLIYQFTPALNTSARTHAPAHTHTQTHALTCAFKRAHTLSLWGLETMELLCGFHLRLNGKAANTMRSW